MPRRALRHSLCYDITEIRPGVRQPGECGREFGRLSSATRLGQTARMSRRERTINKVMAIAAVLDLAGLLLIFPGHNRVGWLLSGVGTSTLFAARQVRRELSRRDRAARAKSQIRATTLVAREQQISE